MHGALQTLSGLGAFAIAGAVIAASVTTASTANAKSPGATYCYNEVCHRVLTLVETTAAVGRIETLRASYYGAPADDPMNPRSETSSGEIYDPERDDNVASPVYPDGTKLLIWHPVTGKAAIARVNNAGPYKGERLLDVSRMLAERLGFLKSGVASLQVVVLKAPSDDEARFKQGRTYAPVPGMIGTFRSMALATRAAPYPVARVNLRPATPKAPTAASWLTSVVVTPSPATYAAIPQPLQPSPMVVAAPAPALETPAVRVAQSRPCEAMGWC